MLHKRPTEENVRSFCFSVLATFASTLPYSSGAKDFTLTAVFAV